MRRAARRARARVAALERSRSRAIPATVGFAPRIALRRIFCVPSVNARNAGSKPNATVRPLPTGSSTIPALSPSAAAPSA